MAPSPWYTFKQATKKRNLKPGDLIESTQSKKWRIIPYHHWSVYIGKIEGDHTIIERTEHPVLEIQEALLEDLFDDDCNTIRVNNYLDDVYAKQKDVVAFARSCINPKDEYNFILENCEHFTTLCRYRHRYSQQVTNGIKCAGITLVYLLTLILILLFYEFLF